MGLPHGIHLALVGTTHTYLQCMDLAHGISLDQVHMGTIVLIIPLALVQIGSHMEMNHFILLDLTSAGIQQTYLL